MQHHLNMDRFEIQCRLPVEASELYEAWLNSEQHSAFTGGIAAIEPVVGSRFTAWDGYITGVIEELEEGSRILQRWRTTEFPDGADDSMLECVFEASEGETTLILRHWNIPEGQGKQYESGWEEHYFSPMREYFSG